MDIYAIAGFKVALDAGSRTMKNAKPYLMKDYNGNYDFSIIKNTQAAQDELYEKWRAEEYRDNTDFLYEARQFHTKILDYNAMMLHASAVAVDNNAYLFSAPSGTGKSTHTKLRLDKFGDRAFILNDDKPVIRIMDDGIFAYGTPWCGSTDIGRNAKVPLKAICFLERADTNWIKQMSLSDGMPIIMNMFYQTFRQLDRYDCMTPISKENASKYLDIIIKIISKIPIFQMGCTPEAEAADVAYNAMSKATLL